MMAGTENGHSPTDTAIDDTNNFEDNILIGGTEVRVAEERERIRLQTLEGEVLNTRLYSMPLKGVLSQQRQEKEMLLSLAYMLLSGVTFKNPIICHPGMVKHIASKYGIFPSHLPVANLKNNHRLALYNALRMKYLIV